MSWVKLDDQFHAHPKAAKAWALCEASLGLHMLAMSHSGCFALGGRVEELFVISKMPSAARRRKAVAALVEAGLWDEVDGGWQIHDWGVYNPDAETREAARQAKIEAGRKGGKAKAANKAASETASSDLAPASEVLPSKTLAPYPTPTQTTTTPLTPQGGDFDLDGDLPSPAVKHRRSEKTAEDRVRYQREIVEWSAVRFPDVPAPLRWQLTLSAVKQGITNAGDVEAFVRRWAASELESEVLPEVRQAIAEAGARVVEINSRARQDAA